MLTQVEKLLFKLLTLIFLSICLFILLLIISYCYRNYQEKKFWSTQDPGVSSYKRDLELIIEYKGKEYVMKPTIVCHYLGKATRSGLSYPYKYNVELLSDEIRKKIASRERRYHTVWKSEIINNTLELDGGGVVTIGNIFKRKEEAYYYDYAVEKFYTFEKFFYKSSWETIYNYYYRLRKDREYAFIIFDIVINKYDFRLKSIEIYNRQKLKNKNE